MNTSDKHINLPISTTSSSHTGSHVTPVYLNLYDLGGCNNTCIHSIGLLFYHCAVETHSTEYGYMGHPYRFTGLYKTSKHDSRFHLYHFRHSIEIGWTWFSEKEIDQIVNGLKPFYRGLDYHTTNKNSIHFAKYLLEQLSNDAQLKHLEPITIIQFPSYIDRARRLSVTLKFLQMFDTEKDIAEINILFFFYMKYKGNIKQICHSLQCDTIDKLKRSVKLIEQGIAQRKLPLFPLFTTFDLRRADDYLHLTHEHNSEHSSNNEQLTLTDIFHQFDTVTLRGRTSVDRYLNIQRTNELENEQNQLTKISKDNGQTKLIKHNVDPPILSQIHRFSQSQSVSQNQGRTPLTSPSASNISGLTIIPPPISTDRFFKFQRLHRRTAIPFATTLHRKETAHSDFPLSEEHLPRNDHHKSLPLISPRPRKLPSSSRKRKLPRDLELTNELYQISNPNLFVHSYTNNALSSSSHSHQAIANLISLENLQINEDIDSSV